MYVPPVNISEIIYGLVCILGVICNLAIIYTILTAFSSKSRTAIVTRCILQISICDLLVVLQIPFLIATLSQRHWPFGNIACQLSNVALIVQQTAKAFLLVLLGLTSYANQIGSIFQLTELRITFMIAICWLAGIVVGIPVFLFAPVGHTCSIFSEDGQPFEFYEAFAVIYTICNFIFPLFVFLFLLCKLKRVTHRSYFERPMRLSVVLNGAHALLITSHIIYVLVTAFYKVAHGIEQPWRGYISLYSSYVWYSSAVVFPILYFLYWSTLREQMRSAFSGSSYSSLQQLSVRG